MLEFEFKGTIEEFIDILRCVIPFDCLGVNANKWYPPRIILGKENSEIERIILSTYLDFSPRKLKKIISRLKPKDCLTVLEAPGLLLERDGLFCDPAGRTELSRFGKTTPPSQMWVIDLFNALQQARCFLIWLGNTWEAWEKGPSHLFVDKLKKNFDVLEVRPVEGFLEETACKVVVFVPRGHEDRVREAMAQFDAGHIGNYSHCTFQVSGQGTFMPLEGTHPYLGTVGKLEKASEFRLETIVRSRSLKKVLKAMLEVHPYEEVAYDVFRLENGALLLGRSLAVSFAKPVPVKDILKLVAVSAGVDSSMTDADLPQVMKKVCVSRFCGIPQIDAAVEMEADAIFYVEDTYAGRIWRRRLGVPALKIQTGIYQDVLTALKDAILAETCFQNGRG